MSDIETIHLVHSDGTLIRTIDWEGGDIVVWPRIAGAPNITNSMPDPAKPATLVDTFRRSLVTPSLFVFQP